MLPTQETVPYLLSCYCERFLSARTEPTPGLAMYSWEAFQEKGSHCPQQVANVESMSLHQPNLGWLLCLWISKVLLNKCQMSLCLTLMSDPGTCLPGAHHLGSGTEGMSAVGSAHQLSPIERNLTHLLLPAQSESTKLFHVQE